MRTKFPVNRWISTAVKLPPNKNIKILVWSRWSFEPFCVHAKHHHQELKKAIQEQKKQGWKNHRYFITHWQYIERPLSTMGLD